MNQFVENIKEMTFSIDDNFIPKSFFDVGCGTGSYLFLLKRMFDDVVVGGTDYSRTYIDIAKQVISGYRELYTAEAIDIDESKKYDIVYSRSIFQYFDDEDYARSVTEKMLKKCKHSIAVLDVHDLRLKEQFLDRRRSTIEDYDKKYENTQHLFIPKSMFIDIAEENDCSIKFAHSKIPGYWNWDFTYDVYLFKQTEDKND